MSLKIHNNYLTEALLKDASKMEYGMRANNIQLIKKEFNATQFSDSQASFQCVNLLKRTEARFTLKMRFSVKATGHTKQSVPGAVDATSSCGSSAYLLGNDNFYADPFCVSRLINQLDATIGGVNFSDAQREQNQIFENALMWDRAHLQSMGLDLTGDLNCGLAGKIGATATSDEIFNLVGSGSLSFPNTDLANLRINGPNSPTVVASSDVAGVWANAKQWVIDRNKKYCKLVSTTFATSANVPLQVLTDINGNKIPSSDGVNVYYSGDNILTQVNVYEIEEDVISPYLCTRYASPHYIHKMFNTESGVGINVTLQFDSVYRQQMFKWGSSDLALTLSVPKVESAQLILYTVNNIPLSNENPYPSMIVMKPRVVVGKIDKAITTESQTLSFQDTGNTYLPRFYVIKAYVALDKNNGTIKNPSATAAAGNLLYNNTASSHIYAPIDKIEMLLGGKETNILQGFSLDDLKIMTAQALRDEDFYLSLMRGEINYKTHTISTTDGESEVGEGQNTINAFTDGNVNNPYRQVSFEGYYIIDMTKVNLGMLDSLNVPLMPGIVYGPTSELNLNIRVTVAQRRSFFLGNGNRDNQEGGILTFDNTMTTVSVVAIQPTVYQFTDSQIETKPITWTLEEYAGALQEYQMQDRVQYSEQEIFAGNWFTNIGNSALNILKQVPRAVATFNRDVIKPVARDISMPLGLASSAVDYGFQQLGVGKKASRFRL